jgi:hypothetical protein
MYRRKPWGYKVGRTDRQQAAGSRQHGCAPICRLQSWWVPVRSPGWEFTGLLQHGNACCLTLFSESVPSVRLLNRLQAYRNLNHEYLDPGYNDDTLLWRGSSVSIVTRLWAGRSGFDSQQGEWRKFFSFPPRPDRPWGVKLTTHILLVPRLRIRGAIPTIIYKSSWSGAYLNKGYVFVTWDSAKQRENLTLPYSDVRPQKLETGIWEWSVKQTKKNGFWYLPVM